MATITRTPTITPDPVAHVDAVRASEDLQMPGPLLVATDGSGSADPAFAAARLLDERLGGGVDVVTVFEPIPIYLPPTQLLAVPADFDAGTMDRLRDLARHQVSRVVSRTADWPVDVQVGDPAATIVRVARERNASLVISGTSRHGIVDRVFGEETAAHIASHVESPMLVATTDMHELPRTVLIAIDLDSPPIPDTQAIRALLSKVAMVYLVNVKPKVSSMERFEVPAWDWTYDDVIEESQDRVMSALDLPGASRQLVKLEGTPATEILGFADYAKVDLIIVGQRRRSLLQRRLRSGLPTQLLRATTCPVLVVPRPRKASGPAQSTSAPGQETRLQTITERQDWSSRLAQISRRNCGHQAALEVDDAELGAQVQVSGYPFMGIDYDHRDDRIAIMLGARLTGNGHLTHFVERPTSIDVLEGVDRRLLVLRIANASGQALLSFPA